MVWLKVMVSMDTREAFEPRTMMIEAMVALKEKVSKDMKATLLSRLTEWLPSSMALTIVVL